MSDESDIEVRNTEVRDIDGIVEMSHRVYPEIGWGRAALESHLRVFPEGQLVAVQRQSQRVVGMAASLIILWDNYDVQGNWATFTDRGLFTNHDPQNGRTLYGAEVMVDPEMQGQGVGKKLYSARRDVCRRFNLLRIRAGARLVNYHQYAGEMSAEAYVLKVVNKELGDPTLSFQLKQGFRVLAVVPDYLPMDRQSLGYAAVIEWVNHQAATRKDYRGRDPRFARQRAAIAPAPPDEPVAEDTQPQGPPSSDEFIG